MHLLSDVPKRREKAREEPRWPLLRWQQWRNVHMTTSFLHFLASWRLLGANLCVVNGLWKLDQIDIDIQLAREENESLWLKIEDALAVEPSQLQGRTWGAFRCRNVQRRTKTPQSTTKWRWLRGCGCSQMLVSDVISPWWLRSQQPIEMALS